MDHLGHLERDCACITDLIAGREWGRPVPDCPDWTVADLVRHLGGVHRWAARIVTGSSPQQGPQITPEDDRELPGWFADGAEKLLKTLRTTDPDAACWTFDDPVGPVAFWRRRQALETALHRVDLQRAFGRVVDVDPALAVDGIDEVAGTLYPRQVRLGRTPAVAPIVIRVNGREWLVGQGNPVGAVEGPATAVLLALWHRLDPADPALTLAGRAAETLRAGLTP